MIPDLMVDGYLAGLGGAVWLLGAVVGVATAAAPWTTAGVLLYRLGRWAMATRPGWWLRTEGAVRRQRRARG